MEAIKVPMILFLLAGIVWLGLMGLSALDRLSAGAHLALPAYQPAQQERPELPPLPGPHEPVQPREAEHFTANGRLEMAQQARAIIGDPNSQCNYYGCDASSSIMRTCTTMDAAGDVIYAMQWLWYSTEAGAWMEGSAWTQSDPAKAERYLRNQGCIK